MQLTLPRVKANPITLGKERKTMSGERESQLKYRASLRARRGNPAPLFPLGVGVPHPCGGWRPAETLRGFGILRAAGDGGMGVSPLEWGAAADGGSCAPAVSRGRVTDTNARAEAAQPVPAAGRAGKASVQKRS